MISKGALKLREKIDTAIKCHQITHSEYELILAIAFEDGMLDNQEKALLKELQNMIAHKDVKVVHTKDCNDQCDCKIR